MVDAKLSKDATSSMSLVALGADAALSDLLSCRSRTWRTMGNSMDSVLDGYARNTRVDLRSVRFIQIRVDESPVSNVCAQLFSPW